MPIYYYAESFIECQYGWRATAAFLQPWPKAGGLWTIGVAFLGGLMIGTILIIVFVVVGHRAQLVELHLNPVVYDPRPKEDRFSWRRSRWWSRLRVVVLVTLFGLSAAALLVGINVGFVKAQESRDVPEAAKVTLYVLFALIHEGINHFVRPLGVTSLATLLGTASPTFVIFCTTLFQTSSSVVAPIIGLLLSSEACFGPKIFQPGQEQVTTSSVMITNCVDNNGTNCTAYDHYEVGTQYADPFDFDGGRCLSSIVVLYTPAFLYIFVVRVLTSPMAWWMARRGTPWLLVGTRPPMQLAGSFLSDRVWLLACFGLFSRNALANPYMNLRRPVSHEALEVLHATEPAVLAFNKLVIAVCPGVLSPIVAAAAFGCFLAQLAITFTLGESPTASQLPGHALPISCVAVMILVYSCYTVVILIAANFIEAGAAVTAIVWVGFIAARWYYLAGAEGDVYADGRPVAKKDRAINAPTNATLLEALLDGEEYGGEEHDDGSYEEMMPSSPPADATDDVVEHAPVAETAA